ncbi:MAG: thermonuclease family protein [Gammaproteobacteria bacterium]|nr:thermonuclease family protein [Gammaproteobacteria bacterium]
MPSNTACRGVTVMLLALAGLASSQAAAPLLNYEAEALAVIDGDTVEATVAGRAAQLRLYGIDAPELVQAHGEGARAELQRLVAGRKLRIGAIDIDRYDRLIALVEVDGRNVNEALLAGGFAWAYRAYLEEPAAGRFCAAEADARNARRGLWHDSPNRWDAPWDYRERQRGSTVGTIDRRQETAASCVAATRAQPETAERGARIATWFAALPAPGCVIKGNVSGSGARIYHLPGTSGYQSTRIDPARGERWFCDEREAGAAGFRRAR